MWFRYQSLRLLGSEGKAGFYSLPGGLELEQTSARMGSNVFKQLHVMDGKNALDQTESAHLPQLLADDFDDNTDVFAGK